MINGLPDGGPHIDLDKDWTVEVFSVTTKRFLPYNRDMQIPIVGGAMVPYGEDSLLYVGGRHKDDSSQGLDEIYQFDGKEMRAKVFRHAALFNNQSPSSSQVNC